MVSIPGIPRFSMCERVPKLLLENLTAFLNLQVKKMAGVGVNGTVTELDLRVAMRTVKRRFIVGLMDRMEESVHRFNVVLKVNELEEENKQCMHHFFHNPLGAKKYHSNSHPAVSTCFPVLLYSNWSSKQGIYLTCPQLFCHNIIP